MNKISDKMSNKKLYSVTLSMTVVVYAENADEAMTIAEDQWVDGGVYPEADRAHELEARMPLPGEWEPDAIPLGEDGDRTIGEIWSGSK